MSKYDAVDFFTDPSLMEDPYPYFDYLRAKCPVTRTPHHGVVAVSGFEEAAEIYKNTQAFSSCISVIGPFARFPVPLEGDIGAIIERYRDQLPMSEHMVTMDPPAHTRERALLMRLLTPKRLKENEAFMERLADSLLDEIMSEGHCEFISRYGQSFAMLVVADVLGVPEADHATFRKFFGLAAPPGQHKAGAEVHSELNTLAGIEQWFSAYIEDRRREPRPDVLTALALAKYPDGSTPEVAAVVRTATFLFAAGQETTARLFGVAMKYLAESPELQEQLRAHPERIPMFIEEALRIESPVKADFRLAVHPTKVGGTDIAPGTPVMLLNGAANRDPRRFDAPQEFRADRQNARDHMAFGRGPHTCPGAPLARAEGRISFERVLARMRNIRLSEAHHGPRAARRFEYEPTWILRGLRALHIEFDAR